MKNKSSLKYRGLTKIISNKNILSLINNFIGMLIGIVSIILLTRGFANKELFGIWIIYVTAVNVFEMLKNGLMRPPLIRFLSGCKVTNERKEIIASNWVIGFVASVIISIVLLIINFLFSDLITGKGFILFFVWYPIVSIVKQPFNNANSIFLSKLDFKKYIIFRILQQGLFTGFLGVYFFIETFEVSVVVVAQLFSFIVVSFFVMMFNYDGWMHIKHATVKMQKKLMKFGSYTMAEQLIGSLYKNSDQFILAIFSIAGPVSVALYTIPLKLADITGTVVRSFINVSFQKMAVAKHRNDLAVIKNNFYHFAGLLTVLLIPFLVIGFVFSEQIVVFLGGESYRETANIFRVFLFYLAFIPINQYLGIVLISMDMPKYNFIRILFNLIIGVGLNTFIIIKWDSPYYMAYTKIIVILVSILMGIYFLRNVMKIHLFRIFRTGVLTLNQYLIDFSTGKFKN